MMLKVLKGTLLKGTEGLFNNPSVPFNSPL